MSLEDYMKENWPLVRVQPYQKKQAMILSTPNSKPVFKNGWVYKNKDFEQYSSRLKDLLIDKNKREWTFKEVESKGLDVFK